MAKAKVGARATGMVTWEIGDRTEEEPMVEKIVSGGQTGVDRAGLDVAFELGIPCGGWCPKGRVAEDGRIDDRYPLEETPSTDYRVRTRLNVEQSEGTLVITRGPVTGGTALTIKLAREKGKPLLIIDLNQNPDPSTVQKWLKGEASQQLLSIRSAKRCGESFNLPGQPSVPFWGARPRSGITPSFPWLDRRPASRRHRFDPRG